MDSKDNDKTDRGIRKHVLVTGARGQLGHELTLALEAWDDVRFTAVGREELDITDREAVERMLTALTPDVVVNCAAYTAVDKAEDEPRRCLDINLEGVRNILKAIEGTKTRLIQISTDYVFDGTATEPYTEDYAMSPTGVYGRSKCEAERLIGRVRPDSVILRTGWLYSPYGHNFVKTILRKAVGGATLKVVNDQTGTPTSARDLAGAIVRIIEAEDFKGGVYNYSNEGTATWYDFAKAIVESSGLTVDVVACSTADYPTRARRPAYSVLDKTKIKEILKIEIPHWSDSLAKCLERIDLDLL